MVHFSQRTDKEGFTMAIGKRIFWFRYKQGLKQKEFGQLLGFSAATSEARITQYEKEARTPKTELIDKMAAIFGISFRRSRNDLLRLAERRLYFIWSASKGSASMSRA